MAYVDDDNITLFGGGNDQTKGEKKDHFIQLRKLNNENRCTKNAHCGQFVLIQLENLALFLAVWAMIGAPFFA